MSKKPSSLMGLIVFGGCLVYLLFGAFYFTSKGLVYLIFIWMAFTAGWYAKGVVEEFRVFKSRGKL
ncbi:TPA: hypothetical protein I8235_000972 [Kluyvera intermedia]|nr:hypothetical protein [Kluyvera intermedia]